MTSSTPRPPVTPAVASTVPTRRRLARRVTLVAVLAVGLFVGGGLGLTLRDPGSADVADADPGRDAQPVVAGRGAGSVEALQQRAADRPRDPQAWAGLGAAYVEQARASADPSFYPRAEGALRRSLELAPEGNLGAFVGMGALANARHDFPGAIIWAQQGRAVSEFNPDVYGVLTDAYTQLGRPAKATAAAQRMLDLSPTLPALARASYDLEQRGELATARALLEQALEQARTPAAIGFCRYYLGELAFNAGDLDEAAGHYEAGLRADPQSPQLKHGAAKVAALRGDGAAAARAFAELVAQVPNPQYLIQYGELLADLGRDTEAKQQFGIVATVHKLFADNGGQDDLSLAEFEADHGDPAAALRHAKAEWDRRKSAPVADAMAWALHKAGRHAEALRYADRALDRGWRNALFAHHRAEIHRALGNTDEAAADAALVEEYNPTFEPVLASFGRPA